MLELSKIRENPDNIIKNLAIKNFSASEIVALILQLDEKRRQLQKENDACLAQQNKMASEIGIAMKAGKKDDAEQLKEKNAEGRIANQGMHNLTCHRTIFQQP